MSVPTLGQRKDICSDTRTDKRYQPGRSLTKVEYKNLDLELYRKLGESEKGPNLDGEVRISPTLPLPHRRTDLNTDHNLNGNTYSM